MKAEGARKLKVSGHKFFITLNPIKVRHLCLSLVSGSTDGSSGNAFFSSEVCGAFTKVQ